MPKKKISRDFILNQALKIFSEKSYYNATMADIADACGILKGSMYHYYPSKEDLMKAVLKQVHHYFNQEVFCYAYDDELSGEDKLYKMGKATQKWLVDSERGQIMGNIGVETARLIPEFSELIKLFFDDWVAALTRAFLHKYSEERAREVAEQCVSEIEGAVMMMRIYNEPRFLNDTFHRVLRRIR